MKAPHVEFTELADDMMVTRKQATSLLRGMGYPVTKHTLQKRKNKDPKFRLFGIYAMYRWGDVREWASRDWPTPKYGNPQARQAGAVVRAVLLGLVGQKPLPMQTVMELTGRSRTRVLDHLAILQERRRIAGYTTRGGIVRVWTEDRK